MVARDVGAVNVSFASPIPRAVVLPETTVAITDRVEIGDAPVEMAPSAAPATPAGSLAHRLASAVAAKLAGHLGAVLAYYPPYPPQPSDQPNAERIRWLKSQIEQKNNDVNRLTADKSRAESERQCKLREKERFEAESYSVGQHIYHNESEVGQRNIELDRVKDKLRYGQDLSRDERWALELKREKLTDEIYKLNSESKDLQYKRNDLDYKAREAGNAADSALNRFYSLGNQIDSVKNEMQSLKDELWRLEQG